ncbi:MAG: YqgE/AlgH family protein [Raineya sp.]|jgi:putative transcriptional regulator|nr:YqgE/AlgH family protein [Raineya sp.]
MSTSLNKGKLLIASPFLQDDNFKQTVILLVEHNEEGTVGFVLNKVLDFHLQEAVSGIILYDSPIYYGGPVGENSLFYIHCFPEISGAIPITDTLYWGGDFEEIKHILNTSPPANDSIRFFAGYAGWAAGQLDEELEDKSWIVQAISHAEVMKENLSNALWQKRVRKMNEEYAYWANMPQDPTQN